MATNDTCCTIVPYFKVRDGKMTQFKDCCERMVALTMNEPGCLFYGFSFDGDHAHCREGYRDAEGAVAHVKNVGQLLGELLTLSEVTRLELHGPESELSKLRTNFAELNPQYFKLEYGFRR